MDNREMWAVKLWGQMKHQNADNGDTIATTWTVHVVTEKGYQSAIDAAVKSSEREWTVEVRGVESVGGPPLVVA